MSAPGETRSLSGRCLCGSVRFVAPAARTEVSVCHCDMCRRWSGGPEFAVECGTRIDFEDETPIARHRSSDWAERAFCSRCGSGLFYRILGSGEHIVNAGVFDDQSVFVLTEQIFVDEKPHWYDFANETAMKTGAQVFAEFAPDQGD